MAEQDKIGTEKEERNEKRKDTRRSMRGSGSYPFHLGMEIKKAYAVHVLRAPPLGALSAAWKEFLSNAFCITFPLASSSSSMRSFSPFVFLPGKILLCTAVHEETPLFIHRGLSACLTLRDL